MKELNWWVMMHGSSQKKFQVQNAHAFFSTTQKCRRQRSINDFFLSPINSVTSVLQKKRERNMPFCSLSLKLQFLGFKWVLIFYQKGGDRVRQLFVAAAADRQNQKWFCVFFFARSRFRVTCAYDRSAAKEMVSSKTTTTSYVDNGSFFSL